MPGYLTIDKAKTVCASEVIAILHINAKKNKSNIITGSGTITTATRASTLIKRLNTVK